MLSENNVLFYVAPHDVEPFPFNVANFRRQPDEPESFNLSLSRRFLGIVINLGEPFDYAGADLVKRKVYTSQYNLVNLPPGEYEVTIPEGLHHSIALRFDVSNIVDALPAFPFLRTFLGNVVENKAALLREHFLRTTEKMDKEISDLLAASVLGDTFRDHFFRARSFDIYFAALNDVAELTMQVTTTRLRKQLAIDEVASYLEETLDHHHTLDNLLHRFGITERNLQEGFKQKYGKTVFAFLTQRRMELAKKMLLDPSRTIKSIAAALGYRDVQNFTTAYKRYYYQVPTDTRGNSLV